MDNYNGLTFDNQEVKEIKFDGNDVNEVTYEDKGIVWSKPMDMEVNLFLQDSSQKYQLQEERDDIFMNPNLKIHNKNTGAEIDIASSSKPVVTGNGVSLSSSNPNLIRYNTSLDISTDNKGLIGFGWKVDSLEVSSPPPTSSSSTPSSWNASYNLINITNPNDIKDTKRRSLNIKSSPAKTYANGTYEYMGGGLGVGGPLFGLYLEDKLLTLNGSKLDKKEENSCIEGFEYKLDYFIEITNPNITPSSGKKVIGVFNSPEFGGFNYIKLNKNSVKPSANITLQSAVFISWKPARIGSFTEVYNLNIEWDEFESEVYFTLPSTMQATAEKLVIGTPKWTYNSSPTPIYQKPTESFKSTWSTVRNFKNK